MPAGVERLPTPAPHLTQAEDAIVAVPVRHWGRWMGAAVALALLGGLIYAVAGNSNIHWDVVLQAFTYQGILSGLWVTIELTVLAMVIGIVLGVISAVMRLSENPVQRAISNGYTWLFRGTPLLVQIIFWFNLALVFPKLGIAGASVSTNTVITPFVAALLGLGLNEGAYMSEIVRGGIGAVDPGQSEAARALGMRHRLVLRRIVLPQAMRVIVPPTGNEVINMLKNTALVSVIAAHELLTQAQAIYSRNFLVIDLLIAVSLWYLVVTTVFNVGQHYLERHFGRGLGR